MNKKRTTMSLPQETVDYLKAWMMSPEHISHPYPREQEKAEIMAETGIEPKQLTNWFVNNRKRYWKPRVEAKLQPATTTTSSRRDRGTSAAESKPHAVPTRQSERKITIKSTTGYSSSSDSCGSGGESGPNSPHDDEEEEEVDHLVPFEDPHTISEGSSSPEHSDDDEEFSIDTSSLGRRSSNTSISYNASLRREEVDVHVLIPEGGEKSLPTVRDMTIKNNVKKELILATFPKCLLQFTVTEDIENDRKKVSTVALFMVHYPLSWVMCHFFHSHTHSRVNNVTLRHFRFKLGVTVKSSASRSITSNSTLPPVAFTVSPLPMAKVQPTLTFSPIPHHPTESLPMLPSSIRALNQQPCIPSNNNPLPRELVPSPAPISKMSSRG